MRRGSPWLEGAAVGVVASAWVLRERPRLAALAVTALVGLGVGYAVYMEELGGAQDGIIDLEPAPYEIR